MRQFGVFFRSTLAPVARRASAIAAVGCATFALPARAQQADVIRGRVASSAAGDSPIENATVIATALSRSVSRTAKTDKTGRYTIIFPGGEGDYLINVTAIGYTPRRFELKRIADEDILIGDVRLTPTGVVLDTVRTVGSRARPVRADTGADVGGADRLVNPGMVAADQMGNLASMASSIPGVLFVQGVDGDPSGFSALGLDGSQNAVTLNGMTSGASDLPRDADVAMTLALSPYDASQGQFSGARLNLRVPSGSNYSVRTSSLLGNAPPLEWTDAAGRALGQRYTNLNLSGGASGPISLDRAFYNVAYQLGRRENDLPTLLNTSPIGLEAEGVAADSIARLRQILANAGVPATVGDFPSNRFVNQGLLLGSFDFAPPSSSRGDAFNLMVNGGWNRFSPVSSLASTLPAAAYDATRWDAMVQLHHTAYYGWLLSETGFAVSGSRQYTTPYLSLPNASVLVASDFANGASGVQALSFGGAAVSTRAATASVDLTNQLSWMSLDNHHRLKLTSEVRHDALSQTFATNSLGTFIFNSLADVAAGTPSTFTRAERPLAARSGELTAAVSLGDSYRPSQDLQVVYGARLDASRYDDRPGFNAPVEQTFGVRNDRLPDALYFSPRIGFSWTYGAGRLLAASNGLTPPPPSILQGGVGLFQNSLNVGLPNQALATTGLPGAVQQLTCVGGAVPTPDWSSYTQSLASIPTVCADGSSGAFANAAPNVALMARDYAAQRSLRSNVQWTGAVLGDRLMAAVNGVYSLNMRQPESIDLNFAPAVRFALPSEDGRPVFVSPASIDVRSGAIAAGDGRVSPDFNRVVEARSDLTSTSRQLQVQLSPRLNGTRYTWGLNYVLNSVRDQAGGFQSTAGNPLDPSSGRSLLDWRHEIQFDVGYNAFDAVRLFWVQSFYSGMPYTPMVASDVNGDGYNNDRAFVFDPAHTPDPALAAGMRSLIDAATGGARACLEHELGRLAARNECEGPWTSNASMAIAFNPVKIRMPERATLSFSIANPLAAADVLLHGESRLHGWGQPAIPDTRLLFVRGFDAQTLSYKYQVNPRFGSTSQATSAVRSPVTLTALMRVDLGPTRERQDLTRALDRGRKTDGQTLSLGELKQMLGPSGLANPMSAMLRAAGALKLDGRQADSLATLNRWYAIRFDSIWSPVAAEYAVLPKHYDAGRAYDRFRSAREASVDLLVRIAPALDGLLTAEQKRKLPPGIAPYLDRRYLATIRSGTRNVAGAVFPTGVGVPSSASGMRGRGGGPG